LGAIPPHRSLPRRCPLHRGHRRRPHAGPPKQIGQILYEETREETQIPLLLKRVISVMRGQGRFQYRREPAACPAGSILRRPADPAVLARQACCSSYSPFLWLAAPGLSLHTQSKARCWCLYALSWAGGITQKLIAMCEHWLPLKIANVRPSFLLQMRHVKNTNWTLHFGAVASEPVTGKPIGCCSCQWP
jgi:hypothetical protein